MRVSLILLSFTLAASACLPGAQAPTPRAETSLPVLPPASDTPPPIVLTPTLAPYPDTPSPPTVPAPLIEGPALIEIQFINELDGWGVTETEIARTTDGGFTWYAVTPPSMTGTGYSVRAFFLDRDHAWVQIPDFENFPNRGVLARTVDGGLTWRTYMTPFSGGHISFLNAQDGWMLADLGVGAGSNAVAVYQTTNGGASWNLKYINDPNYEEAEDSLPLGGLKTGITPLDMQTAWVGGVTYSLGTLYLYRTDDGGSNWSQVSLPLPRGAENSELSVNTDQMEFVTGDDGFLALHMSGDATRTAIYVSRDAGETWTLAPALIPNNGWFDFLSAEEAVIYNGEQFYVTRDAARTWTIIPPEIVFGESLAGLDFVNASSGWVLSMDSEGGHFLYRTHDGGATWFPVIP